jgi:cell division protein FtsB
VEKVEELTLYILQLKAQNDKLQQSNEELLERMNKVEGKN